MLAALYVEADGIYVEQGHYGHRARKATWLYLHGVPSPSLMWGPSSASVILDEGFHSAEERRTRGPRTAGDAIERMGRRERMATPPAFAELLLSIARG